MGAAASCGICLGTTFALCTTAAPVANVHQPVRRRDVQEGGRRHGDGNPGHGGAHPRDEMHHARGPKLVEDHGPYKKPQDVQERKDVLKKAHQRQIAMDNEHAKHPPDQQGTAAQHSAGHHADKQGKKHHHGRAGTGGMGGSQRSTSAEDKEFLRMYFAAEDAKQGKGRSWQDQDSVKEVFYKDHGDYLPKSRDIHEIAATKHKKKLESDTKKGVDTMLDRHGHHAFMRQNSVKGKRGNAAAARLQQDHISDNYSALGKKTYERPGSPKTFIDFTGDADEERSRDRHRHRDHHHRAGDSGGVMRESSHGHDHHHNTSHKVYNAHHHHHPHHQDEWHRTSSHH